MTVIKRLFGRLHTNSMVDSPDTLDFQSAFRNAEQASSANEQIRSTYQSDLDRATFQGQWQEQLDLLLCLKEEIVCRGCVCKLSS